MITRCRWSSVVECLPVVDEALGSSLEPEGEEQWGLPGMCKALGQIHMITWKRMNISFTHESLIQMTFFLG